jgi:2-polyprenyl-3-methyl-5-hydroxy-6-metoxy-1,4-benzoquinol methylase
MLRDTTRTVTYARFLLSNPKIFEGAIVMDVGCGTGILSSTSNSLYDAEGEELIRSACC